MNFDWYLLRIFLFCSPYDSRFTALLYCSSRKCFTYPSSFVYWN